MPSLGVLSPDMLPEAGSLWLLRLLRDTQLAQFYRPILEELNVTRPEHFNFVRPEDLDSIGMGRPGEGPLPSPFTHTPTPALFLPVCITSPPYPRLQPSDSGLPQPSADWLKL